MAALCFCYFFKVISLRLSDADFNVRDNNSSTRRLVKLGVSARAQVGKDSNKSQTLLV